MGKIMLRWVFISIVVAIVTAVIVVCLAVINGFDWWLVVNGLLFTVAMGLVVAIVYWLSKNGESGDVFLVTFSLSVVFLLVLGMDVVIKSPVKAFSFILAPTLAAGFLAFCKQARGEKIDLGQTFKKIFWVIWANVTSWIVVMVVGSGFREFSQDRFTFIVFVFIMGFVSYIFYAVIAICIDFVRWLSRLYCRAFKEQKA